MPSTCRVTSVTPNRVERGGSRNGTGTLDSFQFSVSTQDCNGVQLRLHVNGRSLDLNRGGSTRTGSFNSQQRRNWSSGTYTITFTRRNNPGAGTAIPTVNTETLVVEWDD